MTQNEYRSSEGQNASVALSVIAPCFNEEANIDLLVDRTLLTFDSLGVVAELVLVDDGSSDATWTKIRRRGDDDGRVRCVRHPINQGMEGAWRSGMKTASGALVCLIDADLQNRPEDIAVLYQRHLRNEYDIIQAVRHPAVGAFRRYLFSRALNTLLNFIFRMRAKDNKSGFILCRKEVLADVLRHRFRYRYFQTFLSASANRRGYSIGEVDTTFDQRHSGTSFLGAIPILISARIFWELMKFRVETWASPPQAVASSGVGLAAR